MRFRMRFLAAFALAFAGSAVALAAPPTPRIRFTINDHWRYTADAPEAAAASGFDDDRWQAVDLPHTWNAGDAFVKGSSYRRGIGWYRKWLTIDPALRGRRLYLFFEGANQIADVFVNGTHAARHIGGYTAFVVEVTDLVTFDRSNLVAVRVDNSPNPDVPPLNADFTFYGGIYRDVWLVAVAPVHITLTDYASPGVFLRGAQDGVVHVGGSITNQSDRVAAVDVVSTIFDAGGNAVTSVRSRIRARAGATSSFTQLSPPVDHPHPWSPETPYLYRVRTEVFDGRQLIDAVSNPLGFRWFAIDAQSGLTLNGSPLKLIGTNRHQDHAGLGNALPDDIHRRDIRLIKETGFNFLRLAHYPQDPAVLEETDRTGLVVWEEIPIVNQIGTSAAFAENSEHMLVEMIRQHYNHPSIFFWGYMNEVMLRKPDPLPEHYYETLLQLARRLNDRAHAEDPGRRTVMALSRDEVLDDKGAGDIPDALGMNLYFGWYYGTFDDLGTFLDEMHRRHPSRPLMISEYGAGMDERIHSIHPQRFDFSSEYGQQFHLASLPQIESRPFVLGSAVWNQFDFGSSSRQDSKYGINSKGLFFFDRTPKDAAFYYQAALFRKPALAIAREWRERSGERLQPIWVYSNQPQVELFVNGHSAGSQPVLNRTARWNVELAAGENRIVARAGALEDAATIVYQDHAADRFFAVNAGSNDSYNDQAHVSWDADRAWEPGSWGYAGGAAKLTHHAIFGTDDDALYQATREGMERYQFDVPDDTYEVTLCFAETDSNVKGGDRLFSVRINGHDAVRDLDLVAEYGAFTAVKRSFTVEASGGTGVTIEFRSSKGQASVSAIAVRGYFRSNDPSRPSAELGPIHTLNVPGSTFQPLSDQN